MTKSQKRKKSIPSATLSDTTISRLLTGLLAPEHKTRLYLIVAVLGAVAYGVVAIGLGQDNNWDLRNYHFYNPFALVNGRLAIDYAPAQLQTFLNPIIDLPYYFLVTHVRPIMVGFFLGALQGLNYVLIFIITFELLPTLPVRPRAGLALLAGGIGMYSPVIMAELGATENDVTVTLFVLAGLVLLIKRLLAAENSGAAANDHKSVIIAGLIMGAGLGLKLTVMIYVLGTTIALLVIESGTKNRVRLAGIWMLGIGAGLLVTRGYWMYRMGTAYGSPLFPFYNTVFNSPYYDNLNFADKRALPPSLFQALIYPILFSAKTQITLFLNDFRDLRYAVIYSLLIMLALKNGYERSQLQQTGRKQRNRADTTRPLGQPELFLLVFYITSFIIWEVKFSVIRYIAPLEALAPIVIFILVRRLFISKMIQTITVAVAFMGIIGVMNPPGFQRLPWSSTFFEVTPPQLKDPDNTIVVIAGRRPWAYMIPFFDPGVRFVRIGGNFTAPSRPNLMKSEMRDLLHKHAGPIYLLSRREFLREDAGTLNYYQLYITGPDCKRIKSKHERPGLCLWPVALRSG